MSEVVVVTGIGGMGVACARRVGNGRQLVLADFNEAKLGAEADRFRADGFDVTAVTVDVSDRASVAALAQQAGSMGTLRTVVHTAGLSPTQATGATRARGRHARHRLRARTSSSTFVTDGTVAVCIASMAGYMSGLDSEREHALTGGRNRRAASTRSAPVDLDDFGAYLRHRQARQPATGRAGGRPRGGSGAAGW